MDVSPLQIPPAGLEVAQERRSKFDTGITSMRIHELALQRWLNSRFFVSEGYPIPVVFSKPMRAFADYGKIWQQQGGPFSYLLNAQDDQGRPLFQPHPAPPPFPLISINRLTQKFSPARNQGSHWFRHAGWPTVSPGVTRSDLGNVYQCRMPQAWDFAFQLDHYATRPDTQAHFIHMLQLGWFSSASQPSTWIKAVYPGLFGKKLIFVAQEGEIQDLSEEDPSSNYVVYRTTVNLRVEGWVPDPDLWVVPAFWHLANSAEAVNPAELEAIYTSNSVDLRPYADNDVVNSAIGMPPV